MTVNLTDSITDIFFTATVLIPFAYLSDLGPLVVAIIHVPTLAVIVVKTLVRRRADAVSSVSFLLHAATTIGDALLSLLAACSIGECCTNGGVAFLPVSRVCNTGRARWIKVVFLVALLISTASGLFRCLLEVSSVGRMSVLAVFALAKIALIAWTASAIPRAVASNVVFIVIHAVSLSLAASLRAQASTSLRYTIVGLALATWETGCLIAHFFVLRGVLGAVANAREDSISPSILFSGAFLAWALLAYELSRISMLLHRARKRYQAVAFTASSQRAFAAMRVGFFAGVFASLIWQLLSDAGAMWTDNAGSNAFLFAWLAGLSFAFVQPVSLSTCVATFLSGVFLAVAVWSEIAGVFRPYGFFLERDPAILLGCAVVFPTAYAILTVPYFVLFTD